MVFLPGEGVTPALVAVSTRILTSKTKQRLAHMIQQLESRLINCQEGGTTYSVRIKACGPDIRDIYITEEMNGVHCN